MSTLPRAKSPLTPPGLSSLFFSFTRSKAEPQPRVKSSIEISPPVDFDAGINTSAAWTEHLDSDQPSHSLSDDEPDDIVGDDIDGRAARVLYKFEGKAEFRELSVEGGDQIEILREHVGDGWSLVKNEHGEMGLLPQTYYTVKCSLNISHLPYLTLPSVHDRLHLCPRSEHQFTHESARPFYHLVDTTRLS